MITHAKQCFQATPEVCDWSRGTHGDSTELGIGRGGIGARSFERNMEEEERVSLFLGQLHPGVEAAAEAEQGGGRDSKRRRLAADVGETAENCIRVNNSGSVPSVVKSLRELAWSESSEEFEEDSGGEGYEEGVDAHNKVVTKVVGTEPTTKHKEKLTLLGEQRVKRSLEHDVFVRKLEEEKKDKLHGASEVKNEEEHENNWNIIDGELNANKDEDDEKDERRDVQEEEEEKEEEKNGELVSQEPISVKLIEPIGHSRQNMDIEVEPGDKNEMKHEAEAVTENIKKERFLDIGPHMVIENGEEADIENKEAVDVNIEESKEYNNDSRDAVNDEEDEMYNEKDDINEEYGEMTNEEMKKEDYKEMGDAEEVEKENIDGKMAMENSKEVKMQNEEDMETEEEAMVDPGAEDDVEAEMKLEGESAGSLLCCSVCSRSSAPQGDEDSGAFITCIGCGSPAHVCCVAHGSSDTLLAAWNCITCQPSHPSVPTCIVCSSNKGALLNCVSCDNIYHKACHKPQVCRDPEGFWQCQVCARDPGGAERPMMLTGKSPSPQGSPTSRKPDEGSVELSAAVPEVRGASCLPTPSASPSPGCRDEEGGSPATEPRLGGGEVGVPPELPNWSAGDVAGYLRTAGFEEEALAFLEQEIDGKSLLLMKRSDVLTGLSIKLGPALKIYQHHVKFLQDKHFRSELC
uniref:sterile alpha motif domain-containing protein 13 n=1 Tax=Myxine glutinosa TaxID=7769 RepID=UPI00358F843A